MSKNAKVDLKLLKRLVGELEASLATADGIKEDTEAAEGDVQEYIVEMSKCIGLVTGVVAEATCLLGDIQVAIGYAQSPPKSDPLSKLLAGIKGSGGLPGTN